MARYLVRKECVSVYVVEVEAANESEAREIAADMQGEGDLADDYYINQEQWEVSREEETCEH